MAGYPKTECPHPQDAKSQHATCTAQILKLKSISNGIEISKLMSHLLTNARNVIIYLRRFVGREIDSNIIQNVDVDSGLYPRLFCYPISLEMSALATKPVECDCSVADI